MAEYRVPWWAIAACACLAAFLLFDLIPQEQPQPVVRRHRKLLIDDAPVFAERLFPSRPSGSGPFTVWILRPTGWTRDSIDKIDDAPAVAWDCGTGNLYDWDGRVWTLEFEHASNVMWGAERPILHASGKAGLQHGLDLPQTLEEGTDWADGKDHGFFLGPIDLETGCVNVTGF